MGRLSQWLVLGGALLLTGCDFNFWKFGFTDYDVNRRFADSMALNEAEPPADLVNDKSEYQLFFVSDLHLTDNGAALEPIFEKMAEVAPLAVFYNGDLYNGREEYADFAQSLLEGATRFPHYYVAGNHDQYFGWPVFMERFGSSTYTFAISGPGYRDRVIVLESGSSTLGEQQYAWLQEQLQNRDEYRYLFVVTHSNLVIHSFNFGTYGEDELHKLYALFSEFRVNAVFSGHSHVSDEKVISGVHYCNTAAAKNGHYGLLTVSDEEENGFIFRAF